MDKTYALVVDDLNDGCEFACVWSCTEECDTANLHVSPLACRHICVAHLAVFVRSV